MLREPWLLFVAAWMVPGAGHFLLGRRWRGIAFLLVICLTIAIGFWLTGGLAVSATEPDTGTFRMRLAFVAQIWGGLPSFLAIGVGSMREAALLGHDGTAMPAEVVAWGDLSALFTMIGGLLNLLLAIDAFDRGMAAKLDRSAPAPHPVGAP